MSSFMDAWNKLTKSAREIDPVPTDPPRSEPSTHGDIERFTQTTRNSEENWLIAHRHRVEEQQRREEEERRLRDFRVHHEHLRMRELSQERLERQRQRDTELRQRTEERLRGNQRDQIRRNLESGTPMNLTQHFANGTITRDDVRNWVVSNDDIRTATISTNRQYKFDFSKVNSIEDMGKILQVLCDKHVFTEDYVKQHDISNLVRRVDDN